MWKAEKMTNPGKNSEIKIPLQKTPLRNNKGPFDWKIIDDDTNLLIENKKLNVQIKRYEILDSEENYQYDTLAITESKNNSVALIRNQNSEIGLIEEWRPVPEKWFIACVRGFADPKDENAIATAKREMIEEIGDCKIVSSKKVGELYQNTTFYENSVGLVLLDVISNKKLFVPDLKEGIVGIEFYSIEQVMALVRNGRISDTFTLSALMVYLSLEN